MEQQTKLYELPEPRAAKTLDELLSWMPQDGGEIYQTAWKHWYMVNDHEKIMCSISGGWDSDIMLDLNIRCGGKEKTTFCFFDTGLEYDATKQHIGYLEERYGIEIKVLKPKKAIPTCCKEYGIPFWSKFASEMIHRLQKSGFQWEDEPFDVLLEKYPKCKAALKWWCNRWGEKSRFNIEWVPWFKEFICWNPPEIMISSMCCSKAKKEPAHAEELDGYDLICTGVRKAEGGKEQPDSPPVLTKNRLGQITTVHCSGGLIETKKHTQNALGLFGPPVMKNGEWAGLDALVAHLGKSSRKNLTLCRNMSQSVTKQWFRCLGKATSIPGSF